MEKIKLFQIFLFAFCVIVAVIILILYLREDDEDVDYYKYIIMMQKQIENNLDIIAKGNRQRGIIEEKIYSCKKKLGMKLTVDNQRK